MTGRPGTADVHPRSQEPAACIAAANLASSSRARSKLRADLPPGVVTRVRFTVDKPGSYDFLCDNFCGDKHEEMSGRMLVTAA